MHGHNDINTKSERSFLQTCFFTFRTKYDANMLLLYRMWMSIPPNTPMYHGDMNCAIDTPGVFRPFAFRTHSHAFGTVTTGYKYDAKTGQMTEFARGNPQWPQA